ncbi:PH domain-containing protein [Plectonema cf. radiosum LEGE 06105]|uniref:PH domain-containing protein n=1 Tax=Plectonema cf. radiosum LEGE 06105 TaxID=945769 RepID=A0A8J7K1L6_9CYAN|nr:PH domain-containing protein [Plectonema radiosum]MBE9214801.1 PH domain-containing protein [Plectonema cf. radiosum LEGE 06105]
MDIFNQFMGNASEVNVEKLQKELSALMIEGENIHKAFKLIRDLIVFTNKRIILIDKQGMTGKKTEFLSIPYKSIKYFSKETAGTLDLDAEIKIWIHGDDLPREFQFKRDNAVDEVYQILSYYILST